MPKSNEGQLSLKVIRAIDLQETGVLKYQDPFVVIETSKTKFETEVARGAGCDPEWRAAFELQVDSGTAMVSMLTCMKSLTSAVSLQAKTDSAKGKIVECCLSCKPLELMDCKSSSSYVSVWLCVTVPSVGNLGSPKSMCCAC